MCIERFITILQNELNKDNEELILKLQKTIEKEVSCYFVS